MRSFHPLSRSRSARRASARFGPIAALAAVVLATASPLFAHGSPSGSGGGPGHGDEGIGTLPSVYGGDPVRPFDGVDLNGVASGLHPQVVLSGPRDRVAALLRDPANYPGARVSERRNGRRYEAVLSGVSALRLDAAQLADAGVRVILRFDAAYSGGAGRLQWNGADAALFPLVTEFEIPLQRLAIEGLLDGRGLSLYAVGALPGAQAKIGLTQSHGAIELTQISG